MEKPKLTLVEHNQYAKNGKIPESFKNRRKEYQAWLSEQKKAQAKLDEKNEGEGGSKPEGGNSSKPKPVGDMKGKPNPQAPKTDPEADNDFDNLPEGTEFPYGYGGGMFFLSDGTKIRGEEVAKKAQAKLDEGS